MRKRVSLFSSITTLVATIVAVLIGSSHDAVASSGCNAVNAGGFNVSVSGNRSDLTIENFAVGDNITFFVNMYSGGATYWMVSPANGNSAGRGMPGNYTVPYNVNNNEGPGTTLKQTLAGDSGSDGRASVTATCAPAA